MWLISTGCLLVPIRFCFLSSGVWLLQRHVLTHHHNLYDVLCGVWHIQELPAVSEAGPGSWRGSKHQTRGLPVWNGRRCRSGSRFSGPNLASQHAVDAFNFCLALLSSIRYRWCLRATSWKYVCSVRRSPRGEELTRPGQSTAARFTVCWASWRRRGSWDFTEELYHSCSEMDHHMPRTSSLTQPSVNGCQVAARKNPVSKKIKKILSKKKQILL